MLFIIQALIPLFALAAGHNSVSCQAIFASHASRLDGIAGWGTKLLPQNYFEENYRFQDNLRMVLNSDTSVITPYWFVRGHGFRGPFDDVLQEWSMLFSNTLIKEKNQYAFIENGVEHNLELLELRSSGTEANNYFYELAGYAYKKRTGKTARRPQLLFFADLDSGLFPYGGTFGRSAEMSIRYTLKPQETLDNYLIPSSQTRFIGQIPKAELSRLQKAEDAAIEFIRQQVTKEELEIGGIILEPISVSKGLHFFRNEFLLRLRNLADELGVPIMADEVFTGGGRTGKFWAFQHYEGFYPDLISFGKGLELKGVGWIKRRPIHQNGERKLPLIWDFPRFNPYRNNDPSLWSYEHVRLDNTSVASAADAVRALAIIEAIQEKHLVKAAQINGAVILEKMQLRAKQVGLNPQDIQGIGLVFHFPSQHYIDQLFRAGSVQSYQGRVTPLLTTKLQDFPAFK